MITMEKAEDCKQKRKNHNCISVVMWQVGKERKKECYVWRHSGSHKNEPVQVEYCQEAMTTSTSVFVCFTDVDVGFCAQYFTH